MQFEKLLIEIATILDKLKLPYLVSGGVAIVIWGRPRFTADIDFVLGLQKKDIDPLIHELKAVDPTFYLDREAIEEALKNQREFNLIHPASGLKVDFWILKNEPFDQSRIKRHIKKTVDGTPVYFSSPEDLILIKLLWYQTSQSTRQLEDIQSIVAIQNHLDINYLERWAKRLGILAIWQKLPKK